MTIPAEQIEIARRADILATAKRFVALKRISSTEFAGPCPACGGHDRFSVNTRKQLWNCRACQKGGNVISLVQHALGGSFGEAVADLAGENVRPQAPPRSPDSKDAARNGRSALRIWHSARSIRWTLAETYLRFRAVDVEQLPELDEVLRFEPHCPFGEGKQLPCLVALIRDVLTDEPRAIQRTALASDGQFIDRWTLGPKAGGAIKLWPDAEVTSGLVVGEGLETTASAATHAKAIHRGTFLRPAWALIDSGNLRNLPVLAGIAALTILVDNDANGAGQAAADACAKRWLGEGREVYRLTPKIPGSDFNDIVRGKAHA